MPRSPVRNREIREERRAQILEVARATFARLGPERATVRDIAEAAGMAQGLLYSYFRSKDDLLRAVFREGTQDVAAAFRAADEGGTPHQRLERVIRRSFEIVRERREFWQLSYMLRHQPRSAEALGDELTEWAEGVRTTLEGLLAEAGHPEPGPMARVLFAAIDGVAQHYTLMPGTYPLDATVNRLVRLFEPPRARRRAG